MPPRASDDERGQRQSRAVDQDRQRWLSRRAEQVIKHYLADHRDEMLQRKVASGAVSVAEAYQLLKDLARDPKTGVQRSDLLRYALEFELAEARTHGHPISLAVFDIDHFKKINDELGHLGADEVLRQVAATIRQAIRLSDDLWEVVADEAVVRWGGEEFVVIFARTDVAAASVAAERIRQRIRQLPKVRPSGRLVTVSGGLTSVSPGSIMTWQQLLAAADAELNRAKAAGRDRICLTSPTPAVY
ncbi:MAG: GGDEF domain-containing protein [Candidatus Kerfeldbacteria bacterium]|nr:GGDEF domain-containing protein [Candidatus Kerfeldbacteria bacterium]